VPVAIHIMDDWPATIGKQSFFKSFWNKRANMKFRKLLKKSKILLSISEAMSKEYKERYGRNFIHFHNPIDLKLWTVASDKSYKLTENFVILYAGRIGTGIRTCLYDIANAIEELVRIGLRIEFHIQTTSSDSILEDLKKFKFIKINPPVPYIELPVIFSKADLLLLANDFDNESISFLKYSMPTKASEYMASGTPILLYSSNEIAVTKHAFKYNWAYIVSEKNKNKLEFAISELYENEELRNRLGRTAREYAIKNFDGMIIRDQFRRSFILE
jgi:glycosyltransferase involved in cell wall biosynthesis